MKCTPQCSKRKRSRVRAPPRCISLRATDKDYDTAVDVLLRATVAASTDVHDDPVPAQNTAHDRLNTCIGDGTSQRFRIRIRMCGKTSFARDGFRQAITVSNEVNDSSILSSASRVPADDFAFPELSGFQFDDMG